MRKLLFAATALLLTVGLVQATPNPTMGEQTVIGSPVIAIDGDTLAIGAERIRIIGLDTPETYQAKCKAELMAGYVAHGRLQHLLNTRHVTIVRAGKDRYLRTLATVHVGDDDVADIMVREGLARPYVCPGGRCPARKPWCPALQ